MESGYWALMAMYCCSSGVYCFETVSEVEGALGLGSGFDFGLFLAGVELTEGLCSTDEEGVSLCFELVSTESS